jgi:hypothetical protein
VAASKGPAAPTAGPAGALASAARKRRSAGGWPTMMPVAMPAGAPTTAAAAKELAAPNAGPVGVPAPAVTQGGPTRRWGCTTAVAPMTVPTGH